MPIPVLQLVAGVARGANGAVRRRGDRRTGRFMATSEPAAEVVESQVMRTAVQGTSCGGLHVIVRLADRRMGETDEWQNDYKPDLQGKC
jgi:hypothetical protein